MSYSYIFTCHLRFQNSSRNNNIIIITIKSSNNHNSNKCVWGNRRVTRWMSSVINHQNACYRSIRCKWAQWRIPQRPRHTAVQQVRSKREFNVNICNTHRERESEQEREGVRWVNGGMPHAVSLSKRQAADAKKQTTWTVSHANCAMKKKPIAEEEYWKQKSLKHTQRPDTRAICASTLRSFVSLIMPL